MMTDVGEVERGVVYDLNYYCETPGPEVDEGGVRAYWTGERDCWGKLTFQPVNGKPPLYIFPHEVAGLDKV